MLELGDDGWQLREISIGKWSLFQAWSSLNKQDTTSSAVTKDRSIVERREEWLLTLRAGADIFWSDKTEDVIVGQEVGDRPTTSIRDSCWRFPDRMMGIPVSPNKNIATDRAEE